MTKPSKSSLAVYAKTHSVTSGKLCTVCNLPQAEEINEALRNGVGPTTILNWLREEVGLTEVTESHVAGHKRRHHHQREEANA